MLNCFVKSESEWSWKKDGWHHPQHGRRAPYCKPNEVKERWFYITNTLFSYLLPFWCYIYIYFFFFGHASTLGLCALHLYICLCLNWMYYNGFVFLVKYLYSLQFCVNTIFPKKKRNKNQKMLWVESFQFYCLPVASICLPTLSCCYIPDASFISISALGSDTSGNFSALLESVLCQKFW